MAPVGAPGEVRLYWGGTDGCVPYRGHRLPGTLRPHRGSNDAWLIDQSGCADCVEYARGAGWKVRVKVTDVQQAPPKKALPIPVHKEAKDIDVPVSRAYFDVKT